MVYAAKAFRLSVRPERSSPVSSQRAVSVAYCLVEEPAPYLIREPAPYLIREPAPYLIRGRAPGRVTVAHTPTTDHPLLSYYAQ